MRRAILAAVAALAVAGCGSSPGPAGGEDGDSPAGSSPAATSDPSDGATSPDPGAADRPGRGRTVTYVAMGDSYQAAPGVPPTVAADGCYRSESNYAHVLAERVPRVALTDVTCSGATSGSLLETQLPALDERTDLVTVGIGGNDFNVFTGLVGSCVGAAEQDPQGSPCTATVREQAAQLLPQVTERVGGVLDAVTAAAPRARVVVVGYPDLLPATGSCPDRLPLATGDYAVVREVNTGLSEALRSQAQQRDLPFVDVARASRGHDVCAAQPWVNGAQPAPDGTFPFHPFAVEQAAVAGLLEQFVPRG